MADERGRLGSACSTELGELRPVALAGRSRTRARLLAPPTRRARSSSSPWPPRSPHGATTMSGKAFVEVAPRAGGARRPTARRSSNGALQAATGSGRRASSTRLLARGIGPTRGGSRRAPSCSPTRRRGSARHPTAPRSLRLDGGDFLASTAWHFVCSEPTNTWAPCSRAGRRGRGSGASGGRRSRTRAARANSGSSTRGLLDVSQARHVLSQDPWTVVALARVPSFEGCLAMGARRDRASRSRSRACRSTISPSPPR